MNTRISNAVPYEGNDMYKGNGVMKWCVMCGTHRMIQGGSIQTVLGSRHFCCSKHPNPKAIKCKTQKTPSKMSKTKTSNPDIARVVADPVRDVMTDPPALLVAEVVSKKVPQTPTILTSPMNTTSTTIRTTFANGVNPFPSVSVDNPPPVPVKVYKHEILEYIRQHPGTTCGEISRGVRVSSVFAANAIYKMWKVGVITRAHDGIYQRKACYTYTATGVPLKVEDES